MNSKKFEIMVYKSFKKKKKEIRDYSFRYNKPIDRAWKIARNGNINSGTTMIPTSSSPSI